MKQWLSRTKAKLSLLFSKKDLQKPNSIADDWLKRSTNYNTAQWILFIQDRIVAHSSPSEDPNHDQTETIQWIQDLAEEVMSCWPEGHETWKAGDPRAFDGNMRLARELGLILCTWYARVHYAKTRDPRRPIAGRRMAHKSREKWITALVSAITDDSHDPRAFRGQQWENPFSDDATDGDFV